MLSDSDMRRIERKAKSLMPNHSALAPSQWVSVAIIALFLGFYGLIFVSSKPQNQWINSPITIKNTQKTQNLTVLHTGTRYTGELRPWSKVPYDEKLAIKAEAREKFPEIKNIGQGVDWQPVSLWLAQEKGVTQGNPRDLFRN